MVVPNKVDPILTLYTDHWVHLLKYFIIKLWSKSLRKRADKADCTNDKAGENLSMSFIVAYSKRCSAVTYSQKRGIRS